MKTIYRLLAGNKLLNAVLIVILAILFWVPSFLSAKTGFSPAVSESMHLFSIFYGMVEVNVIFSKVLAFLIFLGIMLMLNNINTRFILTQTRSFLPSLFFVLITAFFPELHEFNPVLPASFFLLLVIHVLFLTYKTEPDSMRFFDIGLLLGTGSLFYAPLLWFVLFVWLSTAIMRPFFWREWIYPVFGILVPYLLIWGYEYVFLDEVNGIFARLFSNLYPDPGLPDADYFNMAGFLFIVVNLVIASIYMIKDFQFRRVYARIFYNLFFWLFIFCLFLYFYFGSGNNGVIYLLSIPLSYLFTNYYAGAAKSFIKRLIFATGFLWAVLIRIIDFL